MNKTLKGNHLLKKRRTSNTLRNFFIYAYKDFLCHEYFFYLETEQLPAPRHSIPLHSEFKKV